MKALFVAEGFDGADAGGEPGRGGGGQGEQLLLLERRGRSF
jgi:hypothetical protein